MKNVGVNLFSLRTLIATEEGLTSTLRALGEMGYNCAQYSGAPFRPDVIKRASEMSGIPIVLTHVPLSDIVGHTEALMEEHASFGCKRIGLGSFPRDVLLNERATKSTIEELAKASEVMKKAGFSLFFHNHHTDCYRHSGVTVLDYMIDNCPDISFTLDTYWLQFGGLSVKDYIKKLSGRIDCVHLKDYKMIANTTEDGRIEFKPTFAPVGEGNLDFAGYYPLMHEAGVKYYLVEQDNAVNFPDPLGEVRRSVEYIRRNFQWIR